MAGPASAGWREAWNAVKNGTVYAYNSCTGYCKAKVEKARKDQEKTWGLKVPAKYDPTRPLVVLIHGLDSNDGIWWSMAGLMEREHFQVGYFNYPSNAEISKSAQSLAAAMAEFHKSYPNARVDLVCHSMGGLVARAYIEGDAYSQPIDRFIAIAPPNHGSSWARWHLPMKINEQYWLWKSNKDWSPLWAFTDGTGGAAQLRPDSKFLSELNGRPRRAGVRYTIIIGEQHVCWRKTANAVEIAENCLPDGLWGVASGKQQMDRLQEWLRTQSGAGDGAVSTQSAMLDGVTDVVKLPADHTSVVMSIGNRPPTSWEAVRERLRE